MTIVAYIIYVIIPIVVIFDNTIIKILFVVKLDFAVTISRFYFPVTCQVAEDPDQDRDPGHAVGHGSVSVTASANVTETATVTGTEIHHHDRGALNALDLLHHLVFCEYC